MGDPKKHRKKYSTPNHPWDKLRIEEEKGLTKEYGFKNKKEIWKFKSLLRKFARKAKSLIPAEGKQADIETKHLLDRLISLGLLEENSQLDNVLDLGLNSLLERRLQSVICRIGLAKTMKQARQFITHKHILIGNKVITSPSYLLTIEEEAALKFVDSSALSNPEHPERVDKSKEELSKEEIKVIKTQKKMGDVIQNTKSNIKNNSNVDESKTGEVKA